MDLQYLCSPSCKSITSIYDVYMNKSLKVECDSFVLNNTGFVVTNIQENKTAMHVIIQHLAAWLHLSCDHGKVIPIMFHLQNSHV